MADVREYILRYMRTRNVREGGKLPTERELGAALRISRSRVRDCLATLESEGVIKRQIGSGTYLASYPKELNSPVTASVGATGAGPVQLIEARIAFESSLPPLIVRNASEQDFSALEEVIKTSEAASTLDEFEKLDEEFHMVLVTSSHNPVILQSYNIISEFRNRTEWGIIKNLTTNQERREVYQEQHRLIYSSLRQRDSSEAAKRIKEHLVTVRDVILTI